MHIAIIDDEQDLASEMAGALPHWGYSSEIYHDGLAGVAALKRSSFDAVLIDWNMPGKSGPEVIRWAMEMLEAPPPFIIMTSRDDPTDIVEGLRSGASDYIVKPEDHRVISARLDAAIRARSSSDRQPQFTLGKITVDLQARTIHVDEQSVDVTQKEFDLAAMLLSNADRPLSRSHLLARIWGSDENVETRTLDVHIAKVRSKLALRPEHGVALQTVFGFGYRLATLERTDSP